MKRYGLEIFTDSDEEESLDLIEDTLNIKKK